MPPCSGPTEQLYGGYSHGHNFRRHHRQSRFLSCCLARDGREEILRLLEQQGYKTVCLTPEDTKYGSVETLQDARQCADLFKQHRDEIDGVLVSLPNFGDERGVANSIRMSGLEVPVLIHAFPDDAGKMLVRGVATAFAERCRFATTSGNASATRSLRCTPKSPSAPVFRGTEGVCRHLPHRERDEEPRVGVVGARPAAFNTVRFSEKLMENHGISVETLDLSEVLGRIERLKDEDEKVKAKIDSIQGYVSTQGVPSAALLKMAKFGVVVESG